MRNALEGRLASIFTNPKIFLDESDLSVGDVWDKKIKHELCKSMSMIAICAPIYYHPDHKWCGLEWAAMEALSDRRLQNVNYKSIMPVMIRKSDPLPNAISRVQYIDFSRATLQGPRYYKYAEFRQNLEKIVQRIREIILELGQCQTVAGCEDFVFPGNSAFDDYATPKQGFPLIS